MNHTVEKTIDILNFVSNRTEGVTLSQITKELDLPKSTVFSIVHTLVDRGMLISDGVGQPIYKIGANLLKLGYSYFNSISVDSIIRPVLSTLCQETNETVFMSVRGGKSDVVYVMKYLSKCAFQTVYSVGAVRPMMATAMGKALMAVMSDEEVIEILTPEQFAFSTQEYLKSVPAMLAFLEESRQRGYILDGTTENHYYTGAVAVPLRDMSNAVIGAISIIIMNNPYDMENLSRMGEAARAAALNISHTLGFHSDDLFLR